MPDQVTMLHSKTPISSVTYKTQWLDSDSHHDNKCRLHSNGAANDGVFTVLLAVFNTDHTVSVTLQLPCSHFVKYVTDGIGVLVCMFWYNKQITMLSIVIYFTTYTRGQGTEYYA